MIGVGAAARAIEIIAWVSNPDPTKASSL